ncbi:NAD-dependent epimerase/dehydratase family protein [Sphingobacterium populi]|uniref:NAD-dependent epimerase/dehydratase family protein n=1 Tax=Sphingobacterium sp. CFCC 11742 TaxID=1775560 RepID=UPI000B2F610C|nr:NAD-dependent epimerase/dehydratase family protein [Sphingobacterium sp. CFCC 11742]
MKIAIIGGSGFVGTKLIDTLSVSPETSVINIDKQPSQTHASISVIGNVLDPDSLSHALIGVNTVVLLAAEHRDDVSPTSLYYDVNVQGMQNTLEAMEKQGVKQIVFTSSVAIYGWIKIIPTNPFPPTLLTIMAKANGKLN